MLPVRHRSLKGHAAGEATYEVASLGEQGKHELGALGLRPEVSPQGAESHVTIKLACLFRLVIDRKNAAV